MFGYREIYFCHLLNTYLPICARPPRLFVIKPTALILCQIDYQEAVQSKAKSTDRPLYLQPLQRFIVSNVYFDQYCKNSNFRFGSFKCQNIDYDYWGQEKN